MNYSKKTVTLIALASLVRCIVALSVELGNDEVYYRLYASPLQWNYFDHPPMVGWLIRLTTVNLIFDNVFFIRLGAILSSAFASWLIFLCGKKIADAYTGFLAACMYTGCIYTGVIAGVFILPDSPQMICWMAGLYLLTGIATSKTINSRRNRTMLLFGVVAGLGMLCKIHTMFLWIGLLLYILLYNRQWLLKPSLYVSGAITIALFYPVIKWNIDNDFITFFYHGSRVNIAGGGFDMTSFFTFAGGQIFYCNPIIFCCIILAVIASLKNNLPVSVSQKRILLLCGLPLIITATAISFFKPVLPHWSGPGYCSLILLTACYFRKQRTGTNAKKRVVPVPVTGAIVLQLAILIGGIFLVNFYPGTLGKQTELQKGDGDFTLDMYGWRKLSHSFDSIYKARHPFPANTIIISNKWFPAAHLDFYVARPLHIKVFAAGPVEDIHQYHWLNRQNQFPTDSCDIYVIIPSNYYFPVTDIPLLRNKLPKAAYTIPQTRNGAEARKFYIWYFERDRYHLDGIE